jgi:exonuclease VII small subunit
MSDNIEKQYQEENDAKKIIETFRESCKELEKEINTLENYIQELESNRTSTKFLKEGENLLFELDEIIQQANYFSDATQLSSIGVENAEGKAKEFNILSRRVKKERKGLESRLIEWQQKYLNQKTDVSLEIEQNIQKLESLRSTLVEKRENLRDVLLNSTVDKERIEEILNESDIKTRRATIYIKVNRPNRELIVIPFSLILQKDENKIMVKKGHIGNYSKGFVKDVKISLGRNVFTKGKNDLDLNWAIAIVSDKQSETYVEEDLEKKQNGSETEGAFGFKGSFRNKTEVGSGNIVPGGKNETEINIEKQVQIRAKGTNNTETGDNKISTINVVKEYAGRTIEGQINYNVTMREDGSLAIKEKGKSNGGNYECSVAIDSSEFINAF